MPSWDVSRRHRTQALDHRRRLDAEYDLLPQRLLPTVPGDDGECSSLNPDGHVLVAGRRDGASEADEGRIREVKQRNNGVHHPKSWTYDNVPHIEVRLDATITELSPGPSPT